VNIPRSLRLLLRLSLMVALVHIVFGAFVRISGSGMGCGDHWPRCAGAWFPPLDQPTLVIEWTHRLLALVLITAITITAVAAWRARAVEGVGTKGGVLKPALIALALVITTAFFGAITVWVGNTPAATVGHWILAASLLATLVTALVRAGDFRGSVAGSGTAKLFRGSAAAMGLTLAVLILGGLTAKVPSANAVCPDFPLCPMVGLTQVIAKLVYIQMAHRVLAFLLFFHLFGLTMSSRKIKTAPAVVSAVRMAFALAVLQVLVAGAMVGMHFPPAARSLHQMVGVVLWIQVVIMTLLARRSAPAEAAVPPSIAVLVARGGGA